MTAGQYIAAQNGAVRLALRDLRAFWRGLDLADGIAAREALEAAWPELLATYGELTVTLAADRFEELSGKPATLVRPVDPERANARMRWALGPLFAAEGDALARMELLADELVKQPGRSTMIRSARENEIRYARVPSGSETCSWCLMLASRGAVYHSAVAAKKSSRAKAAGKFHGACDCVVEPVASDDDVQRLADQGYDPSALYDRWQAQLQADKAAH